VFGEQQVESAEEQTRNWEDIKARERGADASALAGVAAGLAPLVRAAKLQRRAARVGFDWPDAQGPFAKLDEEGRELRDAYATGDAAAVEHEMGDLLFSCVNLSRHLGVDPEQVLMRANLRFETRFRDMEASAPDLSALSVDQLEDLWIQAKGRTR